MASKESTSDVLCTITLDPPGWKQVVAGNPYAAGDEHAISIRVVRATLEGAAMWAGLERQGRHWLNLVGRGAPGVGEFSTKYAKGLRWAEGWRAQNHLTHEMGGLTVAPNFLLSNGRVSAYVDGTWLGDGSGFDETKHESKALVQVVYSLRFIGARAKHAPHPKQPLN